MSNIAQYFLGVRKKTNSDAIYNLILLLAKQHYRSGSVKCATGPIGKCSSKNVCAFGLFFSAVGAVPAIVKIGGNKQQHTPTVKNAHLKRSDVLSKNHKSLIVNRALSIGGKGSRVKEFWFLDQYNFI